VSALGAAVVPMPAKDGDELIEWVDDLVGAIYGEDS
jgi:hypothetical protein